VISRPEPRRLIVGAGKRDIGNDMDMPRLVKWLRASLHGGSPAAFDERARVVELNDQHAHVEIDESNPAGFGDLVAFGVSHPCTTFDKWRRMQLVNGDYSIAATFSTYF
jgi:D-serine dehydratase